MPNTITSNTDAPLTEVQALQLHVAELGDRLEAALDGFARPADVIITDLLERKDLQEDVREALLRAQDILDEVCSSAYHREAIENAREVRKSIV